MFHKNVHERRSFFSLSNIISVKYSNVFSRLKASFLALAGKFDSMILPAIDSPASYQIISDEKSDVSSLFLYQNSAQEYQLDDSIDETTSEKNIVNLMKQGMSHQKACITSYASGAGIAGVVGFGYKALFYDFLGWGLSATVWSAVVFAFAYSSIYLYGLRDMEQSIQQSAHNEVVSSTVIETPLIDDESTINDGSPVRLRHINDIDDSGSLLATADTNIMHPNNIHQLLDSSDLSRNFTAYERFKLVLSLWPYTIPLFTVYVAEYTLQAGVWSAIGFPVTSATARAEFYQYSNWAVSAVLSYTVS